MISTVAAGLAASPLMALDLKIDADSALSVDNTPMLVDKSSTTATSTDAEVAVEMVTPMDDSKFVGNQVFTKDQVKSRSQNSPFIDKQFTGRVAGIINGEKMVLNNR